MKTRKELILLALLMLNLFLMGVLFVYGNMGFNVSDEVVLWQLRFPKIVVAFLAGGMLASSGLLLQVFFQNTLAGPDLLGINAGASLGVAIAVMGTSFLPMEMLGVSQVLMAMLGAGAVFLLLIFLAQKSMSRITLLILGLLIASFTSSFISVLVSMSPSLQVKNFLVWSMGSFQKMPLSDLPLFSALSLFGIGCLIFFPKKLNQFIIGESYAKSMGVDVKGFKIFIILICSFLVAVVTAYCGPIGFIGIITPHVARTLMRRSDSRFIMPAVFLVGSSLALLTEFILIFFTNYSLATNSILGLIGAPAIAFYVYKERKSL